MITRKKKKRVVPPPGRKLSPKEAREASHAQFGKAFKKLAK